MPFQQGGSLGSAVPRPGLVSGGRDVGPPLAAPRGQVADDSMAPVPDELIEDDSAQGPPARVKKAPAAPSLAEWEEHIAAGHTQYRGWCPFCVAGKGKSEAHRKMEVDRDQGIPGLHIDYAYMGRELEDRASPILVGKFTKDRWPITHPVPCKGTQHKWVVERLVKDVLMSGVR